MSRALALLQERVQREEVARVPVFDVAERPVLTLLHIAVCGRRGHLDVGIEIMLPGDEVAFQLADSPDREPVPPEPEIDIEHVLQRGPLVQAPIDVLERSRYRGRQGSTFPPPPGRLPRFQIEALASVEDLRVDEHLDARRHGPSLDVDLLDVPQVVDKVGEARRRAVVVDDVSHDALEGFNVSYLVPGPDVLLNDLPHDVFDVAGLRLDVIVLKGAGKAAIGVERVHDLLVTANVLDFVYEKVLEVVVDKPQLNRRLKLVGRLDGAIATLVEIEVNRTPLSNSLS